LSFPDEPTEHATDAHLNIRGDAFGRKALDDFFPSHR